MILDEAVGDDELVPAEELPFAVVTGERLLVEVLADSVKGKFLLAIQ